MNFGETFFFVYDVGFMVKLFFEIFNNPKMTNFRKIIKSQQKERKLCKNNVKIYYLFETDFDLGPFPFNKKEKVIEHYNTY